MKKIKLLLLVTSFLLLTTPTLAEAKEPSYVTKWEPITEILEDRVTFQHAEFLFSNGHYDVNPESYTLRIVMDGAVIEEGPYNPGDVVEVDYDNSSAHAIGFTLWAHYPGGKPFTKHQLGLRNIDTKKAFDWNWEYDAPTCEGLKITWPKDLPHTAIDVNIRVKDLTTGEIITKTFRDADGFELGIEHIFKVELEYFEYQWVQVHGTDYHWKGSVVCREELIPETPEKPKEPEVEEPKEPEQPEVPDVPEEPEVSVPDVPEAPEPKEPNVPTLPVTGSAVNWVGYAFAIVGLGMIIVGRRKG